MAALLCLFAGPGFAQTWRPLGPPGGDVRALAVDASDSRRIYLGTSDGHIFGSRDAGETWQVLGRAGSRHDAVITTLLVDPRQPGLLFAAAWTQDPLGGGGVFRSDDGARTWREAGLAGHAVRALAQAPSDPDLLVAGTLDGVYRSRNAGRTWQRISPVGHEEIRNLDSVAIDPRDPDVLYIGTFHLPWKTEDGGRTWFPIHEGMIDDSDVFSISIDPHNPRRVYASACSGIYRSDTAGERWQKIQGMPFSARRTHVIAQEPQRPATVYAGTTEGLWLTANAGASWRRVTPRHWVVNALALLPDRPGRLVVGVERLGVLVSDDGGESFRAANAGFYHRQVVSLALDPERPERILAVLANAPEPILATDDGGQTWAPLGPGLTTEGLLRVYASPDGWWATLERGGLMRYDAAKRAWFRAGRLVDEEAGPAHRRGRSRTAGPLPLAVVVNDLAFSRTTWLAATPSGLLASRDRGATWTRFPFAPLALPVSSVRASPDARKIWLVSLRGMVVTHDGGGTWAWRDLPPGAGGTLRLDVADEQTLVATARNGLYLSRDAGNSWQHVASGLPAAQAQAVAIAGDVFLVSMQTRGLYISYDRGRLWTRIEGTFAEGFFPVVTTRESGGVIYAASATEGVYAVELTPRSEASASAAGQP